MMMLVPTPTSPRAASVAGEVVTRIADPATEANWDAGVSQFPACTLFHSSAWARVLMDSYGFRAGYVLGEQNGNLRALLPLMEVDNWPKGRRGVSLPFTDECAILASDPRPHTETVRAELVRAAMDAGQRRGWKYLELRGGSDFLPGARPSLSFYGHDLELERDEKQMFGRCGDSAQRAVRKAARAGVKVEIATDLEAVRTFCKLHGGTRRKHGVPPQPFDFFESVHRQVLERGQGFVALARLFGRPIAAAMFFHFGRRAIYKFGASDDRFQELRGNNLLMWEAIRWLAWHGFASLNFGRTSLANDGLRRFKLSWGACESRISYCRYDFGRRRFIADRDQASGWQTRIFRMLPAPIFRRVGALLYPRAA